MFSFAIQLPLYQVHQREDEGFIRVWHATRDNARGTPTFRRVIWVSGSPFPACDCNFHTSSGIPYVHMLLILQKECLPLYDRSMFHVHWTRRTAVRLAGSIAVPSSQESICIVVDTSAQDTTQQPQCSSPTPIMKFMMQRTSSSQQSYNLQDNTPNSDIVSPTPNKARPSDKVTTGKLMALSNSLIDLVTRPAAKTKGLDQKLYDMLKTIRTQLIGSGGDNGNSDQLDFHPPDQSTSRTLFEPSPACDLQDVVAPTHRGGAPQKLRLKRNHEAAPLTAAFAQQKFAVGVSVSASQVTEIARSRSRHPSQRDTLCRFCGAAGCSRKRCPKVARFGSRFVSAQTFFTTVQQLLSTPVLFHTLPILEEVQHGQLLDVDDNWKTGKDFRHIVLKSWLRSSAPQQSGKVFISIRRIKKNLVWLDHEELGVVVDGQQLYEKFVKYKLAKKSVSKIIVVQGLYVNAN